MKDEINVRLQALVGQPLIGSNRAADMEMFSFGELVPTPAGRTVPSHLAGRYGLHLQCPWRIVRSGSLIVGYDDLREPKSGQECDENFDPDELETTLREELLEAFHREREDRRRLVTAIAASQLGDLSVTLDDDCMLEVFPDSAGPGREHWRLLDLLGGHLVISTAGFEYRP